MVLGRLSEISRLCGIGWSSRFGRLGVDALAGLALLLLLLPLLYALLAALNGGTTLETPLTSGRWSLRWLAAFVGDARWTGALGSSLQVAALSVPIALVCGGSAALAVERCRVPGREVIGTALLAPLLLPPVVLGMQALALHQRLGLWGTPLSPALAHSLWGAPVVVLVLRAALALVPAELEEAARGLGASPLRAYWAVTLPLVAPAIVVAVMLSLVISLNELVMALFLATPRLQTLPVVLWPEARHNLTPIVAAAAALTVLVCLPLLALSSRLVDLTRPPGQRT
jgi:ABC-type spermidine/putrescine transport system permease subunit II